MFAVWLFALAEQVTAVRDVLCLSHKPKSNRSESVVRVATEPLLSPRVLCSLSPPFVPLCIRLLIRRDLTAVSITLGGRQVQLYLVVHHLSRSPQQFQLLVKREKLPENGAERSLPDQRTEPLDWNGVKSVVNSGWTIFLKRNLPSFL